MAHRKRIILFIFILSLSACQDEKAKKKIRVDEKAIAELHKESINETEKSITYKKAEESKDDFLASINEEFIKDDVSEIKSKDNAADKSPQEIIEKNKESEILQKKKYDPDDDGSWVIKIDKRKISKKYFENSYKQFTRTTGKRITKEQFVNIFLQNDIFKRQSRWYFNHSKRRYIKEFVKKQAVIENYLKEKAQGKIKTPSNEKLKAFKQYVLSKSEYKNLSLKKDRRKIMNLYKMQMANQKLHEISQSLKGEFRILQNDEWENEVIEKYVSNEINLKKATGKNYKKYWLYKILLNQQKKAKSKKEKQIIAASKKKNSEINEQKKIEQTENKAKQADKKPVKIAGAQKKTLSTLSEKDAKDESIDKSSLKKDLNELKTDLKIDNTKALANKPAKKKNSDSKINHDKTQENKITEKNQNIAQVQIDKENNEVTLSEESDEGQTEKEPLKDEIKKKVSNEVKKEKKTVKKDYGPAITYYIRDVERKIRLYKTTGLNPNLVSSFKKNPQVRMQFLERFLLEELVYRKLKKSKALYSWKYKNVANQAVENFTMGYYMKRVLGLRNQQRQQQYLMNYMQKHIIKMSDRYFDGESKN